MTLRIEEKSEGPRTILRLSGRIHAEHVEHLKAQIDGKRGAIALDLADVTLVDVESVRFLGSCQDEGVELLQCSAYIRAWIRSERDTERDRPGGPGRL